MLLSQGVLGSVVPGVRERLGVVDLRLDLLHVVLAGQVLDNLGNVIPYWREVPIAHLSSFGVTKLGRLDESVPGSHTVPVHRSWLVGVHHLSKEMTIDNYNVVKMAPPPRWRREWLHCQEEATI